MRVLKLVRSNDNGRSGVFTSGIVSISGGRKIALYFTGWKHAGKNLADVLRWRAAELDVPIQMCDALSRNTPKADGCASAAGQLSGAWKTAGCRRCSEL